MSRRELDMEDRDFERIIALKRTPLLRYVPFETLREVARAVQARTYLAGEEVVKRGAGAQHLLILEAGAVSIGYEAGARTLAAPASFGEVALAGERIAWPQIRAAADSRVSFLRAQIFEDLCGEHPVMAVELYRLLARRLHEGGLGHLPPLAEGPAFAI